MILFGSAVLVFCLGYGFAFFVPWAYKRYLLYRANNPKLRTIDKMPKKDREKFEAFKAKHKAILLKWMREHQNEPPPIVRDPNTGEFHWMPRKLRRKNAL